MISTILTAHHPQKKIIKKIMDRRPKKKRPSDINRNNVNLNKCISKVDGAPPDYTLLQPEDVAAAMERSRQFWEHGDPTAEWYEATEEDFEEIFPRNRDPLPKGGVPKNPPVIREYPY